MDTQIVTRKDKLAEYETRIELGFRMFYETGDCLIAINQDKLYKEAGYKTFDDYCQERWNIKRGRAYQLIEATKIYANLSTIVDKNLLPTNDQQLRSLASVPPEQQTTVYEVAVKKAGNKPPTGKVVAETATELGFSKAARTARGAASSLPKLRTNGSVTVEQQYSPVDDFNQTGDYDEISGQPVKRVKGFTKDQLIEMLGEFDDFTTCPYCGK